MNITIEKARPQDAERIIEYMKITGGESDNLTFGSEGLPISVEEEEAYLKSLLTSTSSTMLVAKKAGKIVGDVSFRGYERERMKHRGEIGISVLKSEWGQGIGSMLMEEILKFAKETAKAEIVSLEVRSDNERAIRLYKKFGFEKIGEYKGFFKINGTPIDFDLMNLYLYPYDGTFIRKMTKQDKPEVLMMMRQFYASPAVSTNGSDEIFRQDMEHCMSDCPYLEGFIFENQGRIQGYGMIAKSFSTEFGKPCIWIEDIYIKEAYRGLHIGTRFLEYLEREYPDTILRLEVEEENKRAVKVYEKNGFDYLPYAEMKKIL